jgi:hypothetical protein
MRVQPRPGSGIHADPFPMPAGRPEEYRPLVGAGVFEEDARVDLIDGFLVAMSPRTRARENAIAG